jgi:hypothetical protein
MSDFFVVNVRSLHSYLTDNHRKNLPKRAVVMKMLIELLLKGA